MRASSSANVVVATAYRYGEPSLDAVMRQIALGEASRVVVVPLFPQRTDPTTGTALQRTRGAAARAGIANRLVERAIAPDDAGYVAALVARWREATASVAHAPQHLVISFHGIPVRFNRRERDTYVHDCQATTRAFLQAVGWPARACRSTRDSRYPDFARCRRSRRSFRRPKVAGGAATPLRGPRAADLDARLRRHPPHAWERGTNENTNGLLRQYLPKGGSMAALSQHDCNRIAAKLNRRPRKRLGYRTPEECYVP